MDLDAEIKRLDGEASFVVRVLLGVIVFGVFVLSLPILLFCGYMAAFMISALAGTII